MQSIQKSFTSTEQCVKRKKISENYSSKFDHRKFNNTTIAAQMAHMSITDGLVDLHTNPLIKLLQCQNYGYDFDLSSQKWELSPQLQSLPSPFPNRLYSRFNQLMKKLINVNLSQRFRLSAAKQLIELLDSLDVSPLRSSKANKRSASSNGLRSVESHLRVLELSVCEKHCPNRLISLICDICSHLVVLYGLYTIEENDMESDSESSQSHFESSHPNLMPSEYKVAYVAKMLRCLSSSKSSQYQAGILSLISYILVSCNSSDLRQDAVYEARYYSISAKLVSDVFTFTDALDKAANVTRLARFISLTAGYNELEFIKKFPDLLDILIGWCVDLTSANRGVAISSLLRVLSCTMSRWFFDLSKMDDGFVLAEYSCDMLGHLLEDADKSVQKAVVEYRQASKSFVSRRNAHNSFASSEVSQNFIAAKLYLSVLAGICLGIKSYVSRSSVLGVIKFASLNSLDWNNHLTSILRGLEMLSSVTVFKSKPSSAPRTYVPPTYSLPLLTYADILQHVHSILLFTITNVPDDIDHLGQKVKLYLSQPPQESIIKPSFYHTKVLCDLTYYILEQVPQNSPNTVISTFKMFFGTDTLFHRMKTSSTGSMVVFDLLFGLSKRCFSGCDMLVVIVEMCIADFQLACTNLSTGNSSESVENELLVLFSTSLFASIWKSVSDDSERKPFARASNSRIILILANVHRQFALIGKISQRLRLAFWSLLIFSLKFEIDRVSECVEDLLFIVRHLLLTASNNLQELILSQHFFQTLSDSLATRLCKSFCTYLLHLLHDPRSPVRANNGLDFCTAIDLLIRIWNRKTASSDILELACLCANHPLPRIQLAGADLLVVFGPSLSRSGATRSANFLIHWYISTNLELSTSLITCPSINAASLGAFKENNARLLRGQGAFPSLPAAAGILGILTRGAPYVSGEGGSRLELLANSYDWLRRLACLISPFPSESSTNWFASDTSPLSLVFLFTSWSMVDYKLKVAPWANPVKTFLSVEAVIHALLTRLTKTNEQSLVSELQGFLTTSTAAVSQQSETRQIRQSSFVVTFIRLLEKATSNAVDGFVAAIPPVLPSAHVFFKANALTCFQWFNRVRLPLVTLAAWLAPLSLDGSEANATVVWNVYNLIRQVPTSDPSDLLNSLSLFGNPEKIIIFLIQALYYLRAADDLNLVHA